MENWFIEQNFAPMRLKYEGCGTTQRVKLGEKEMSAGLRLLDNGENLWFTALSKEMQKLTLEAGAPENATTDHIAAALLQLQNIKNKYDMSVIGPNLA